MLATNPKRAVALSGMQFKFMKLRNDPKLR